MCFGPVKFTSRAKNVDWFQIRSVLNGESVVFTTASSRISHVYVDRLINTDVPGIVDILDDIARKKELANPSARSNSLDWFQIRLDLITHVL